MTEYRILDLGEVEVPAEILLRDEGKKPATVPVPAVLLEKENILFDTGCGDGRLNGSMPWSCSEEQTLAAQLAKYGKKLEDIRTVVLSHSHSDHVGGAYLFPNAEVWYPAEDWERSRRTLYGAKQHPVRIGENPEIAPGVHLLSLPGHTANLLGLLLRDTQDGCVLFPSDAVYTPLHFDPVRFPELHGSEELYWKSVNRVKQIAEEYGARIIHPHWPIRYEKIKNPTPVR